MKRLFLMLLLMNTPVLAVYDPPIGIPMPFTIGGDNACDVTYRIYDADPGIRNTDDLTYTASPAGGFYTHYVNSETGSDSGNNFGTEGSPRKTLPADAYIFPGSIIECHGNNISDTNGGQVFTGGSGTVDQPVFIRGVAEYPDAGTPIFTRQFFVRGSYVIVENFEFDFDSIPGKEMYFGVRSESGYDAHHVVLRHCYMHGSFGKGLIADSQSCVNAWSLYAGYETNNVVFYDNEMDADSLVPPDVVVSPNNTGIGMGWWSNHIWILDNDIYHLGGDSIGSGHGVDYTATYYYIGRNLCHDNAENGIDMKEVNHFVVSQNKVYNLKGNPDDQVIGSGIVIHTGPTDAPKDTWVIFNEIYDISGYAHSNGGNGIQISSNQDGDTYIIGNVIHDVKDLIVKAYWWNNYAVGADTAALIQSRLVSYSYVGADGVVAPGFTTLGAPFKAEFDGAYPYFDEMDAILVAVRDGGANGNAFMFWESLVTYVINNTFYNNDNGIRWDYGGDFMYLYNNIIGKDTAGGFLFSIDAVNFNNVEIEYNLFYQPGGVIIDWGGTPYTVAELITNTTKGDNCLEGDPTFTDKANHDYSLQAGSPAIDTGTDAGTVNTIYNLYYSTYGESIKVAYDGTVRSSDWDMGAYETAGAGGGAKYFVVRAD